MEAGTATAYGINDLLGVETGPRGPSLAESVERGLSVAAVDRVAAALAPGDASFRYKLVSKPTLERRKRKGELLNSVESERLARLAKVYDMAMRVFRDEAKAEEFLSGPHMMLRMRSPRDVALASGPGADQVVSILGGILSGVAV